MRLSPVFVQDGLNYLKTHHTSRSSLKTANLTNSREDIEV